MEAVSWQPIVPRKKDGPRPAEKTPSSRESLEKLPKSEREGRGTPADTMEGALLTETPEPELRQLCANRVPPSWWKDLEGKGRCPLVEENSPRKLLADRTLRKMHRKEGTKGGMAKLTRLTGEQLGKRPEEKDKDLFVP